MADWLFDDEGDRIDNTFSSPVAQSSLSGSQQKKKKKKDDGPDACLNCGFADFYFEDASGHYVCSRCHTQSQTQIREEDDYADVEGLAAKVGGRVAFVNNSTTGSVWGNDLRRLREKKDISRKAPPLPGLKACINGMSYILKFNIMRICRVLNMSKSQHQEVKDIAKTLFFNYIESWQSGAQKYHKIYPTIRFDLRDMFLPWTTRKGVHLVLLEYFIEEKKNEQADAAPEQPAIESTSADDQHEKEVDIKVHTNERPSKHRRMFTKRGTLFQKAITATNQSLGYQEAALLLPPDMVLAMCIVWLSVVRRGVTLVEFVHMVQNRTLPFFNAFGYLPKEQQDDLKVVESSFRLERVPSRFIMERMASLVLLSGKVKSHEAFAGRALQSLRTFRTLHEATIPVYTANLVSSMGMDTRILRSALSLMGLIQGSSSEGLPKKLHNINAESIHSLTRIAAVVFCAIILSPEWKGILVARGDPNSVQKHASVIPWTENQLNSIRNGPELIYYLQFCQDYLQDCQHKSSIYGPFSFFGIALDRCTSAKEEVVAQKKGLTRQEFDASDSDSIQSSRVGVSLKRPREDEGRSLDDVTRDDAGPAKKSRSISKYSRDAGRLQQCPVLAGMPLNFSDDSHEVVTPFKRRILHSFVGKKRKHLSPMDRRIPSLDQNEALLLEYLAFVTHSSTSELKKDLEAILS